MHNFSYFFQQPGFKIIGSKPVQVGSQFGNQTIRGKLYRYGTYIFTGT